MRARTLGLVSLAAVCTALSACALLGVKEQREAFQDLSRIRGQVRVDPARESPIVVVLVRPGASAGSIAQAADFQIVDHFQLPSAGSFAFMVNSGTYRLAAFADLNANLVYDPGEPALVGQPSFELATGETKDRVELVIPAGATLDQRIDILAIQARTPKDQQNFSLGRFTVWGDVVSLDDPKFGEESGRMGMWRFADFLFEVGPGVYFLEKYDPAKVPVLFVHGISGYPQQFSTLIEKLDRKRFQPWFYFYPSGIHLDGIASHLAAVVEGLRLQHGFDKLVVVAHSMGGLVSRAFILKRVEQTGHDDIPLFVAISSPWGGSESAANIGNAPKNIVVYSWLDMNPSSDFLKGLFLQPPDFRLARPLPAGTAFHMLLGYQRKENSFGPSGDGTLTLKSEARIEATLAAKSVLPLDYDHVGILHSDEAAARLNEILAEF